MHPRTSSAYAALALFFLVSAGEVGCGGQTFTREGPSPDGGTSDASTPDAKADAPLRTDGGECELEEVLPPIVTVTDGTTGAPICDAVLTGATAGFELSPCVENSSCTGNCPYLLTDDASGNSAFSATITASGYSSVTSGGFLTQYCGCNGTCPSAQHVTVTLVPEVTGKDGGSPPPVDDGGGPPASCPSYASIKGNDQACADAGQTCAYTEGTCSCTNAPEGLPMTGGSKWFCTPITPGCPAPEPSVGSACTVESSKVCDYGACSGGGSLSCTGGQWEHVNTVCEG